MIKPSLSRCAQYPVLYWRARARCWRERVSGAITTQFESFIASRVTGSKSDAVWSLVIEGDLISVCILPAHLVGIPVVVNAALAIHRDLKRSENSQAASRRMGGLKTDYRVLSVTVARRTCCHF
jgi:hypothetical protein